MFMGLELGWSLSLFPVSMVTAAGNTGTRTEVVGCGLKSELNKNNGSSPVHSGRGKHSISDSRQLGKSQASSRKPAGPGERDGES